MYVAHLSRKSTEQQVAQDWGERLLREMEAERRREKAALMADMYSVESTEIIDGCISSLNHYFLFEYLDKWRIPREDANWPAWYRWMQVRLLQWMCAEHAAVAAALAPVVESGERPDPDVLMREVYRHVFIQVNDWDAEWGTSPRTEWGTSPRTDCDFFESTMVRLQASFTKDIALLMETGKSIGDLPPDQFAILGMDYSLGSVPSKYACKPVPSLYVLSNQHSYMQEANTLIFEDAGLDLRVGDTFQVPGPRYRVEDVIARKGKLFVTVVPTISDSDLKTVLP